MFTERKRQINNELICIKDENTKLITETNRKISKRVEYNEQEIIKDYKIKKKSITHKHNNSNFFDFIVALNKFMLNEIIGKYKWIFCKLEIIEIKKFIFKNISISLIDKIGKLFVSKIIIDKKIIGKIFFYKK